MKKTFTNIGIKGTRFLFALIVAGICLTAGSPAISQIYEPEGINMPGAWNTWTNPPTNNLALASSTQVTGGKIELIDVGTPRYQTMFSVKATGGDLTAGTYEWLFTSGSSSNYYQNKWAAVTVTMNTLQLYTKEGATNNSITLADNKWYTMNYEDLGYVDTRAIFMETSSEPVDINTVSVPVSVMPSTPAIINVGLSDAKSVEENIFIRYSVDAWATSSVVPVVVTGTSGTAEIPGQTEGTTVSYYAFSTTLATVTADYDLVTIRLNNNDELNYTYTVMAPVPSISFANLQWPGSGNIGPWQTFEVFGQVWIPFVTGLPTPAPGLKAWVGYNVANTDPATWTDWIVADYNAPAGNNDEFKADLGAVLALTGIYYYATRYQYNSDPFVYGGYSATGGGYWDGIVNVSGWLDVVIGMPEQITKDLTVYPNPTSGSIHFELQAPATLKVINTLGQLMLQQTVSAGLQEVDLSGLKNGIYHVQIAGQSGITGQSVVKK